MYLSLSLSLYLSLSLIRLCFLLTPISCLGFAINLSDLTNVCVAILRVRTTHYLLDCDHTHQSTTCSLHFQSG